MVALKFGANFVIFLLFFGLALVDALETRNWIRVGFWVIMGIVFFFADNLKKK